MVSEKEYIERGALKQKKVYSVERHEYVVPVAEIDWIPASDVVSRGVYEQVQWERDMAMQQLEEHGIPFGAKADVVEVVRCKDCKYYKHFKGLGNWCHRRIRSDIEYHTKTTDFCSFGERKEQNDGE